MAVCLSDEYSYRVNVTTPTGKIRRGARRGRLDVKCKGCGYVETWESKETPPFYADVSFTCTVCGDGQKMTRSRDGKRWDIRELTPAKWRACNITWEMTHPFWVLLKIIHSKLQRWADDERMVEIAQITAMANRRLDEVKKKCHSQWGRDFVLKIMHVLKSKRARALDSIDSDGPSPRTRAASLTDLSFNRCYFDPDEEVVGLTIRNEMDTFAILE